MTDDRRSLPADLRARLDEVCWLAWRNRATTSCRSRHGVQCDACRSATGETLAVLFPGVGMDELADVVSAARASAGGSPPRGGSPA